MRIPPLRIPCTQSRYTTHAVDTGHVKAQGASSRGPVGHGAGREHTKKQQADLMQKGASSMAQGCAESGTSQGRNVDDAGT